MLSLSLNVPSRSTRQTHAYGSNHNRRDQASRLDFLRQPFSASRKGTPPNRSAI